MSQVTEMQGQCLCGAVTIVAKRASHSVGACHCGTCRRWGGGPLMAIDCGTDISLDDAESVSVFNSSDWAERGFCKRCGTHLFYRLKANGQHFVPAGVFERDAEFEFDHQVFVDERPAWYRFANKTSEMTGSEAFARYGASE